MSHRHFIETGGGPSNEDISRPKVWKQTMTSVYPECVTCKTMQCQGSTVETQ